MALHTFMDEHRDEILEATKRRIVGRARRGSDEELMESIPELYNDIVAELRGLAGLPRETGSTRPEKSPTVHGAQRLRLGFTITELVHDYGALCNSITDVAEKKASITPKEYQVLNQALDVAIAAAVSEYASLSERENDRQVNLRATEHLGFVAHELRNAISAAMISFDAIRRGHVAIGGRTSNVLERSLLRLRALIDRSLTEVRLKSDLPLNPEPTNLRQLLVEVQTSTILEAQAKRIGIVVQADPHLEGPLDRQLMVSALANLVQNAINCSPQDAEIHLRCIATREGVTFEVEDECPAKTGGGSLGLGLAITRQAIEAHRGRIHVRNVSSGGFAFIVDIPLE